MNGIEDQFEQIASQYISVETNQELSKYELTVNWPSLKKMLPGPPAKILDYGCGGGTYSQLMSNEGYDVLATDIAPSMIKHLKNTNIKAKVWDYKSKPLADKFDAILAKLVLQFVKDLPTFAKAVRRQLNSNGRLIISVPNPDKSRQDNKLVYPKEIGESGLVVNMIHREEDEYQQTFEAAGFKPIKTDLPVSSEDSPDELPRRLNMLFEVEE